MVSSPWVHPITDVWPSAVIASGLHLSSLLKGLRAVLGALSMLSPVLSTAPGVVRTQQTTAHGTLLKLTFYGMRRTGKSCVIILSIDDQTKAQKRQRTSPSHIGSHSPGGLSPTACSRFRAPVHPCSSAHENFRDIPRGRRDVTQRHRFLAV